MEKNIGHFLTKRALLSPHIEAIVSVKTQQRMTFEELNARTNRCAALLRSIGVDKGDRIALLLKNGSEFVEIFFAIAKVGAVCVPLNWRLAPEELSFMISDADAHFLVFGDDFRDVVTELNRMSPVKGLIAEWICVTAKDDVPDFALDYAGKINEISGVEFVQEADDDDLLFIMYTSGTTGRPKGVVHTHQTALWAVLSLLATVDKRHKDRYLIATPMFHVAALIMTMASVYKGITSIVMHDFDPRLVWETIDQEQVTSSFFAPSMLIAMQQVMESNQYDLSQLRWFLSGASPLPITLIRAYQNFGIEIHQAYALTETCGIGCTIDSDNAMIKIGSTGKPFFHTSCRVVNEHGNDVRPGERGEIILSGAHVMKRYWNLPTTTGETIRNGWLYTGDSATVDEDGFIYILDRIKDLIISGGENISPAEIENIILKHPNVADVAVIGLASKKWGESPVAIIVRSDDTLTASDVLEFCAGKLARFKVPKGVLFVEALPCNPSGKVLKRILREQFSELTFD